MAEFWYAFALFTLTLSAIVALLFAITGLVRLWDRWWKP